AISGMQLKGDVVLNGTAKGNYTTKSFKNKQGTLITEITEIPKFNVQANWANGYFKWSEMPLALDHLTFDLNAENTSGNYKTTKVDLKNIDIKANDDYVKGRLKIDNLIDFNTDTDLKAFVNLSNVKNIFPIKEVDFGGQL